MAYGISRKLVAAAAAIVIATPALAQDGRTRAPAEGLAILDCAPAAPAPEDSCLVRVPSGNERGDMSFSSLGSEEAEFEFVKSLEDLPGDLTLSATLVLIDLSVGDRSGRRGTWNRERDLIAQVVSNLPSNEKVAIYGFGNEIAELSPFSTRRSGAEDVISDLNITEQNTRLVANATRAIEILSQQDDVLLKNLILITDGDEEGLATVEEISEAAEKAGVSVSALGMFWRAQGNARTTRGIDVLKRLTAPQKGLVEEVFLQNPSTVNAVVADFIRSYGNSVRGSGLIVPVGQPVAARINIEMIEPVVGQPGRTQTQVYSAEFRPVPPPAPVEDDEQETKPEVDKIFGLPAMYVYIGAGVLVVLLLLLAILLLRRGPGEDEDELELDGSEGDLGDAGRASGGGDATIVAPAQPPIAFLVRVDNGHKFPVASGRATLGRSSSNAVVIPDGGVSRVHAELNGSSDGRFTLNDLGSLNGTLVNDRKIKGTQRINVGDIVGLGSVRLKLVRA